MTPESPPPGSLYDQIGADFVRRAITLFYERAFVDPIIGHFFHEKDRAHITAQQIDFAAAMLGGPRAYRGKALVEVHRTLDIRRPHFGRRQVLMGAVLEELGLDDGLRQAWLRLEEQLRPLILRS